MRCFWGPNNYGTAIPKSPCHAPIHVLNPEYVWEVSGRLVVEGPTMSNPYLHQHHPWAQMGVGLPSFRSFYRPYEKRPCLGTSTTSLRGAGVSTSSSSSSWAHGWSKPLSHRKTGETDWRINRYVGYFQQLLLDISTPSTDFQYLLDISTDFVQGYCRSQTSQSHVSSIRRYSPSMGMGNPALPAGFPIPPIFNTLQKPWFFIRDLHIFGTIWGVFNIRVH